MSQHPPRVLVVDDNQDAADTFANVLECMGYDVEAAYDGQQALEKAVETAPDVVILDIDMPVMNGVETARALKAEEATRCTRLVALTGLPAPDWPDTEADRFDVRLAKPICVGEMATLLERLVAGTPTAR
jgi:two-component system, chemotaxis family, CheB/CheR fusion protein